VGERGIDETVRRAVAISSRFSFTRPIERLAATSVVNWPHDPWSIGRMIGGGLVVEFAMECRCYTRFGCEVRQDGDR
jgi:hypothetical protein